jgi:hypothetical protein
MKFKPGVLPQCPNSRGLMWIELQRLAQQWIGVEINLSHRKVVCRAPIGMYFAQLFRGERFRPGRRGR